MSKQSSSNRQPKVIERRLKFEVKEPAELMTFLQKQFPEKSRTAVKSLLVHKQIYIDFNLVTQFNYPLQKGQTVVISNSKIPASAKLDGLKILYEDEYLIVIDKNAGLLSIATNSEKEKTAYSMLRNHVKQLGSQFKLFVLHRLDKDTSGVMMYAKAADIQEEMQRNWHRYVTQRLYIAVVEGSIKEEKGVISTWLSEDKAHKVISSEEQKGRQATTNFKVIKRCATYTMLELFLETGRKNQIRVHLQELGHNIIGDRKYGAKASPIGRMGLHARTLEFIHPATNEKMKFESQIPKSFLKLF